jgi:hypothetical protein
MPLSLLQVGTACSKLVTTTGNKQCEHNLSTTYEQICNNLFAYYTRKNAQVVTGLQTRCYKICSQAVYKLCSHCLFLVVVTSLGQAVNNL